MAVELPQPVRRVFFSRFGGHLRPVQDLAFQMVEPDRDCLITASTGTGKTEAAFVPIAIAAYARLNEPVGIRALVVSPTRALATDLHTRMAPVFDALGLRLDVATGDKDSRRQGQPTDILIRTPEGLDGTICRHADDLKYVKDVLIDEVHVFLDSPRGTQLVGLLSRLETLGAVHRRFGLSATLPDVTLPSRARLLRDPVIVADEGGQGMDVIQHRWLGGDARGVPSFLEALRRHGCRKAIGFAKSKARVETLCQMLDTGFLRGKCLVHHGSTSSAIRREAEARLRKMQVGLVIATTTLEVGIDIGDVDTCILFDAPGSASSFLQRAGRAGRRGGLRRVVCVSGLYDRATEFGRLIGRINKGQLGPAGDARPFLTGCLQQTASLVAASGAVSRAAVGGFLRETYDVKASVAAAITRCLVEGKVLTDDGDDLDLGERGKRMFEDRSIHLTFAVDAGVPVVDEISRRRIGVADVRGRDRIRLGGVGRQVVGVDRLTGDVISVPAEGGDALFAPAGVSVFEELARRCGPRVGVGVRV